MQLVKQTLKKKSELNEIKNVETKGKQLIKSQKKLLGLFDDLTIIIVIIMRAIVLLKMKVKIKM